MALGDSPLLSREGRDFVDTVRRFAREQLDDPDVARRDAAEEFWREGWRRCASFGLCGLPAPEEFGGGGADRVTTAAGFTRDFPHERRLRDAIGGRLYSGTSEMMRQIVARGMGL